MNRPHFPKTLTPVRAQLAFAELLIAVANARPQAHPQTAAASPPAQHAGRKRRQPKAGAPPARPPGH
jgi:hypothetical protein